MASPPFSINQAVPADDDFVSPFPLSERGYRDVVESWFLVEGNVQGRSNLRAFDFQGSDPAGTASVTTVWADADGDLKYRVGTGTIYPIILPAGIIVAYGGTTEPDGWIFAYGQAISRTTYAALFTAYSTIYGSGDGSTTFNVPDLRGRVIAGQDDMGGSSANRLTGLTNGVDGDTLGAAGGLESMTIAQANLPNVTLTTTIAAGQGSHSHSFAASVIVAGAGGGSGGGAEQFGNPGTLSATLPEMSGTTPLGGSGTTTNNVQPTFILNYIIKI